MGRRTEQPGSHPVTHVCRPILGGKCTKLTDIAALVHAGMSHREQGLFRRVTPVADVAYAALCLHHPIQNGSDFRSERDGDPHSDSDQREREVVVLSGPSYSLMQ